MFGAAMRNTLRCMHNNVTRKRAPQVRVNDLIANVMRDKQFEDSKNWRAIRDEVLKNSDHITEKNVDVFTMDYFLNTSNYSLGKSYFEFLKENNFKPNLATVGKYLRLFYFTRRDSSISSNEEDYILHIFNDLQEKYKVFDSYTSENLIGALSKTKKWECCLKLLDEMKIMGTPTAIAYSSIICAALRNKQIDLCWKLLHEMLDSDKTPLNDVYCAFVDYCENKTFQKYITQLLELLQRYDLKINEEAANRLIAAAKRSGFSAEFTNIQSEATCNVCKNKLELLKMSPEEFENLKEEFFKNVVIGKNVFSKSTPEEVKRFKDFIEKQDKFDVVVDGLNVAYLVGSKQPSSVISGFVVAVVDHFVRQNKKVLVCGRVHMKKWPKRNLEFISSRASMFLTDNLSQDDPYLLYCALSSGLNTTIISKDLMRSHLFLLKNPYYKSLFKRWLTQNLYQISFIDNRGRVTFKPKQQYVPCVQKNGDVWHVPYEVTGERDTIKWICLKL